MNSIVLEPQTDGINIDLNEYTKQKNKSELALCDSVSLHILLYIPDCAWPCVCVIFFHFVSAFILFITFVLTIIQIEHPPASMNGKISRWIEQMRAETFCTFAFIQYIIGLLLFRIAHARQFPIQHSDVDNALVQQTSNIRHEYATVVGRRSLLWISVQYIVLNESSLWWTISIDSGIRHHADECEQQENRLCVYVYTHNIVYHICI